MKSEKYIAKKINYPDKWDIEKYPTLSCVLCQLFGMREPGMVADGVIEI